MKAKIYQQMPVVTPTEMYGEHVWEGVLDEYTPTYGVLGKSLRDTYGRLTIDYSRFGQPWSGITVPVTFQSNQQGGGMFSYVLSQPITSNHLNHSFLTAFILANVIGGRLTSYNNGNLEIFSGATRKLHAYDELYYNRSGWFNVPDWGLNDVDGENPGNNYALNDPGTEMGGNYGADWYTDYTDESWLNYESETASNFADEVLLRMPTIELWEWEMPDETGTLARCPIIELDEVTLTFKVNRFLKNYLTTIRPTDQLWVTIQMRTMTGVWSNSTVSIDLNEYKSQLENDNTLSEVEVDVPLDVGNLRLWDGKKYKEEKTYRENLMGAPYMVVQVFDADPARYFLDTGQRFFDVVEGATIQELEHTSFLTFIDDRQALRTFFIDHLLDSEIIGMNVKTDEDYISAYNSKVQAYEAWVEAQEETKTIRVLFAVGTLVYSIATLIATKGASAGSSLAGIVFATDQLQSVWTGQSIFSRIFGHIVLPIMEWVSGEEWTAEQWTEAKRQFNVFAIYTRKNSVAARAINAVWSTVLMVLLQKGISALGNAFFSRALDLTMFQKLEAVVKTGNANKAQQAAYLSLHPKVSALFDEKFKYLTAGPLSKTNLLVAYLKGGVKAVTKLFTDYADDILNTLKGISAETQGLLQVPLWFKLVYHVKQFIGGLISPTEWIEQLRFLWTGSMFSINNPIGNYLWNYFDNVLFTVFEDDSTWGMFKAFWYGAQGDYSHYTQYWRLY